MQSYVWIGISAPKLPRSAIERNRHSSSNLSWRSVRVWAVYGYPHIFRAIATTAVEIDAGEAKWCILTLSIYVFLQFWLSLHARAAMRAMSTLRDRANSCV